MGAAQLYTGDFCTGLAKLGAKADIAGRLLAGRPFFSSLLFSVTRVAARLASTILLGDYPGADKGLRVAVPHRESHTLGSRADPVIDAAA